MPVSIRRPRAVVFDILGTASKSGFLEKILFPFLKVNLENYVGSHWNRRDFIKLYQKIQEQSVEFNKQEPTTPVVQPHDSEMARGSLINFINFVTENVINSPAVTQLRFKVWFEGYQQAKIRTPIYSDVPARMRQWFAEGIRFYVFSNTWVEAQKALLRNTNHGDLTNLISGHYDNEFGLLTETDSWRRLCADIREDSANVLFLTKAPQEAQAASEAGVNVTLVLTHRHNVKAVPHDVRQRFPYVRTLNDLNWLDGEQAGSSQQQPGTSVRTPLAPSTGPVIATALTTSQPTQVSQPLVSGATQATQATQTSASASAPPDSSNATTMGGASASTAVAAPSSHRASSTTAASRTKAQSSHSHSKK